LPPPSGSIKPHPLLALNHFTLPIATSFSPWQTKAASLRRALGLGKAIWLTFGGPIARVRVVSSLHERAPIVDAEQRVDLISDGRTAAAHVEQDDGRFDHCSLLVMFGEQ
jgi:hypothetical protein